MAGGELSTLGAQHSDRFVYMDAARDRTRDYSALGKKMEASGAKPPLAFRFRHAILSGVPPETTPLRNEAQLNCVSLRSQLNCEVTCGAV